MTTGSPWFRPTNEPGPEPIPADPYAPAEPYASADPYASTEPYAPADPYAPQYAPAEPCATPAEPYAYEPPAPAPSSYESPSYGDVAQESPYTPPYEPYEAEGSPRTSPSETMPLEVVEPLPGPSSEPLPGPGRAERRRAAKGGRAKGRRGPATDSPDDTPPAAPAAPLSRVEARRAARAAKDSVGVVASRVVGELFITFGVVMLLFVTYQLWWTNVLAGQETNRAKAQIEDTWAKGDQGAGTAPDAFEPGQGFAIMYIPKLDVVVPIAEGISKSQVLDKGMVGHYGEGKLKTAMPADKKGNFAVAGHRNTHGEPFRYINQLKPGDPIVVETQNAYYTYEMASILPQTSPSNVSVIDPVPKQSGFDGPGRYITLTTCTPEFTSTYRMIVWGKLIEERPRSEGKPKALVG
ncbi:class E sortase [Streptomyces sp. SR27]|uniref:class E sortase n=1 Tax=Streptomyces sp. SR27 TaxID=3076630 RepID=UPI00295B5870|nr:class E sortase [Streptomyces sp. SR27]MDV9189532.1 class E sortase [Streptomyces sp. SR27]